MHLVYLPRLLKYIRKYCKNQPIFNMYMAILALQKGYEPPHHDPGDMNFTT